MLPMKFLETKTTKPLKNTIKKLMQKNKSRVFTMGRPAKNKKRDLEIVKQAHLGKMTLAELAKHYRKSKSRISHIIADRWEEYIKSTKENY